MGLYNKFFVCVCNKIKMFLFSCHDLARFEISKCNTKNNSGSKCINVKVRFLCNCFFFYNFISNWIHRRHLIIARIDHFWLWRMGLLLLLYLNLAIFKYSCVCVCVNRDWIVPRAIPLRIPWSLLGQVHQRTRRQYYAQSVVARRQVNKWTILRLNQMILILIEPGHGWRSVDYVHQRWLSDRQHGDRFQEQDWN